MKNIYGIYSKINNNCREKNLIIFRKYLNEFGAYIAFVYKSYNISRWDNNWRLSYITKKIGRFDSIIEFCSCLQNVSFAFAK